MHSNYLENIFCLTGKTKRFFFTRIFCNCKKAACSSAFKASYFMSVYEDIMKLAHQQQLSNVCSGEPKKWTFFYHFSTRKSSADLCAHWEFLPDLLSRKCILLFFSIVTLFSPSFKTQTISKEGNAINSFCFIVVTPWIFSGIKVSVYFSGHESWAASLAHFIHFKIVSTSFSFWRQKFSSFGN